MIARKIKVIQVITRLIKGGAQKVCLDLVEGLPKDIYEVYLVSGNATGSEGSLWERAKGVKDIKIRLVPEMEREISPLHDIVALLKLYHHFKVIKPDIVHSHTSKAGFIACLAARMADVPVIIYSPHGHLFAPQAKIPSVSGSFWRLKLFYSLRKFASSLATKVIALNHADKDEQVKLGLAGEGKYEVVYNGVDIPDDGLLVNVSNQLRDDKPYPVLVTVGRLTPEKGQVYLLDAVKELKVDYPDIRLVIIGDGSLKRQLKRHTEILGIEGNVSFPGIQDEIGPYLKDSDIFVLPSLYEAFGIVLLEAMANMKPVVASRVNGIPEVVEEGVSGILVPPAKSTELAEAIKKLAFDNELAQRIGEEGYKRVKMLFTREKMIIKFDKLYQQLLENL
ncbi:MAG: glycosyltransferase family 4 protein [Planctomycetes bacterium]|nr:glycosyltransferase family 4 protein [Planctomycetota bacterium]